MKRVAFYGMLWCLAISGLQTAARARTIIRMGTLAPRGSAWHKILKRMGAEWRSATGGEVILRIFPGGSVGDEGDMIRKMRIGQLQAAAVSNAGLADIEPGTYALMIPLMFDSYEEWNYVRNAFNRELEKRLSEKGFVVLTWSDVGSVYFFSQEPLQRPDQLRQMKLAASAGQSAEVEIMKWAGFNPVPISTVDTLAGLQTGLINALYMPAILAEGSQVYRYARNMTDLKWVFLQGALIVRARSWQRLPAQQRRSLKRITAQVGESLRKTAQKDERASLEAMKRRGLTVWSVDQVAFREWQQTVDGTLDKIRQGLVPSEMLDEVQRLRAQYRTERGNGAGR
ncbi:MAG: TRAP transporter substrate-binding protein DctP [Acidobacteriota bacterium]